MEHDDTDDAMFSRTGLDSPMGKLCDSFKTDVDADTGALFRKLCNEADTTPAAVIRDFIYESSRQRTYSDICHDAAKVNRAKFFGLGRNGSGLGPSA